jgi:hypothetical protein
MARQPIDDRAPDATSIMSDLGWIKTPASVTYSDLDRVRPNLSEDVNTVGTRVFGCIEDCLAARADDRADGIVESSIADHDQLDRDLVAAFHL